MLQSFESNQGGGDPELRDPAVDTVCRAAASMVVPCIKQAGMESFGDSDQGPSAPVVTNHQVWFPVDPPFDVTAKS